VVFSFSESTDSSRVDTVWWVASLKRNNSCALYTNNVVQKFPQNVQHTVLMRNVTQRNDIRPATLSVIRYVRLCEDTTWQCRWDVNNVITVTSRHVTIINSSATKQLCTTPQRVHWRVFGGWEGHLLWCDCDVGGLFPTILLSLFVLPFWWIKVFTAYDDISANEVMHSLLVYIVYFRKVADHP